MDFVTTPLARSPKDLVLAAALIRLVPDAHMAGASHVLRLQTVPDTIRGLEEKTLKTSIGASTSTVH